MNRTIMAAVLLAASSPAAALNVFACEPEWGSLLGEIAGDLVDVTVGTTAMQDPHQIQARPSLIAAMRGAELLVCTGADLEIGWLPLLLRRSGNPMVQRGSNRYFLAADFVRKLEVPRVIDRAQGDVHPQGNPHIHLNPRNISRVADALAERLMEIDPANRATYETRLDDFENRWDDAMAAWEERGLELAGMRVVSHHLSFSYLIDWLDLDLVTTLEPKPGVPPSAGRLAKVLEQLTPDPPAAVIRTPYENERPAQWLSERLDILPLMLPYTIGGRDEVSNLFSLYDVTLSTLEEAKR